MAVKNLDGQSRRVRQERADHQRPGPRRRLRQPRDPRPPALRDGAGQDGGRRPADVRATADGQLLPVKFTYIPQVPGEYKLTLEAVPQPGELVTTNNRLEHVRERAQGRAERALPGRRRCGSRKSSSAAPWTPRPTSKSTTCGSIRGTRKRRPADFADRFKPGKYDVYILGDLDSTAFHGDELDRLAEASAAGRA